MEALRRAWLQVKANGGAPGVDGVTIAQFEQSLDEHLAHLQAELESGTYRPRGVLRVLVPKRSGGLRPLAIWVLRDRIAQRVVYDAIAPLFESMFLPCSFGFRPGRGGRAAVEAVIALRDAGYRWVVDADIQNCFDSIDSRLLMQFIRQRVRDGRVLRLIHRWLKADIMNSVTGRPTAAGTAQGGILSPLFANIYLHRFDTFMVARRHRLVRYADDFVVLCPHRPMAQRALQDVRRGLTRLRLRLNPHKTRIVHFDEGFKFLGVFFLRDEHYFLE